MDKAQKTVLAACFLLLVVGGLWSRLTPVEVAGADCADPPDALVSECFDAEGDRSEVQIAVSAAVLASAYAGVKVVARRRPDPAPTPTPVPNW